MTPCIKLVLNGVDIDLLLANIALDYIPDTFGIEDLKNENEIFAGRGYGSTSADNINSLGGPRVNEKILDEVKSCKAFSLTLRCVKLWAKNAGIYSSVIGYCGGVSWAILVAYICKHNPNLETCQLLDTFFRFYRYRKWEGENPLNLDGIHNDEKDLDFELEGNRTKIYYPNKKDAFPIITPCFPSSNTSHNVSTATRSVILSEIDKAIKITGKIMKNRGNNDKMSWNRLFKKFPIFNTYQNFIQVQVVSKEDEKHQKWKGFVESKLRPFLL